MKIKTMFLALLAMLASAMPLSAQEYNITPAPFCVGDAPYNVPIKEGEFDFKRELKLYFDGDIAAEDRARLIAAAEAAGLNFEVVKRVPKKHGIVVSLHPTPYTRNEESYSIITEEDNVLIVGHDARGLFYALQSVRQLVESGEWQTGWIADQPRFE
jgi:N-acetyl-beta-hexosaminidase